MMSDVALEVLRTRVYRSYERGRLIVAARAALVIAPLTAICARETEAYLRCVVIGVLLLCVAIAVRWRQWRGIHAANAGLLTGIVPMTAALVLCRFASAWPPGAAIATCTSAGVVAGALGGRIRMEPPSLLIAGLTASLGCIGIGIGTAVGGALGVAAGAVVAMRLPRHV